MMMIAGEAVKNTSVKMQWRFYWRDVVKKFRVIIRGWPDDIPFANLSDISSALPILGALLRKWQQGTIFWESISDEEFGKLDKQRDIDIEGSSVEDPGPRKERKDKGKKQAHTDTQALKQVSLASIGSVAANVSPNVLTAIGAPALNPDVYHTALNITELPSESASHNVLPATVDTVFTGSDLAFDPFLSLNMFPMTDIHNSIFDIPATQLSEPFSSQDDVFVAPETDAGNTYAGLNFNFEPLSDAIFAQMADGFGIAPQASDELGTTDLDMIDFTSMLTDSVFPLSNNTNAV
jgi:hypothetical protein